MQKPYGESGTASASISAQRFRQRKGLITLFMHKRISDAILLPFFFSLTNQNEPTYYRHREKRMNKFSNKKDEEAVYECGRLCSAAFFAYI